MKVARSSDNSLSIYDPKRYQNPEVYHTSNSHHECLKPIFLHLRSRSPVLTYLIKHIFFPGNSAGVKSHTGLTEIIISNVIKLDLDPSASQVQILDMKKISKSVLELQAV